MGGKLLESAIAAGADASLGTVLEACNLAFVGGGRAFGGYTVDALALNLIVFLRELLF